MWRNIAIVLVLVSGLSAYASEPARDGNWWRHLNRENKLAIAIGIFEGVALGRMFATSGLSDPDSTKEEELYDRWRMVGGNVVNNQIADGLDTLYEDYRNRNIPVYLGTWIVKKSISGASSEELESITRAARKLASDN